MSDVRDDERGSSTVEFVLVGTLLTVLTLGVLQLALAVYVRNVVHDAAVEGAYVGALADTDPSSGAERTAQLIRTGVGDGVGAQVSAAEVDSDRGPEVEVRVVATLPLVGLLGIPSGMEVTGRAPRESLE